MFIAKTCLTFDTSTPFLHCTNQVMVGEGRAASEQVTPYFQNLIGDDEHFYSQPISLHWQMIGVLGQQ